MLHREIFFLCHNHRHLWRFYVAYEYVIHHGFQLGSLICHLRCQYKTTHNICHIPSLYFQPFLAPNWVLGFIILCQRLR